MLKYDQEKERYTYNDRPVPRVSEIVPKGKFFVSDERLEETRQEGLDAHGSIKMYWDFKGKDTMENPLLIEFDYWYKENRSMLGDLVCYEKPMYSKIGFAGRPDLIFSNAIVDLKRSRGNAKTNALQLAGYSILIKEHYKLNIKKWIIIYYDGKIRSYSVYNPLAVPMFKELLRDYYLKVERDEIAIQLKNYMEA
jgi:hypothetical protein